MSLSPGVRRRQKALARWAKRAPGYRFALEQVLPRVRRNAVLTDLAWRVFAPRHGAGHVDVALLPDRQLTDRRLPASELNRLPVVGFLATGLTEEQATRLLADVAALQRDTGSFRPVLVLDRPIFGTARKHGYVLEHVVPEDEWASGAFGQLTWETYLATRLVSVVDRYQLWQLLRLGPAGLTELDRALLRALVPRVTAARNSRQAGSRSPQRAAS